MQNFARPKILQYASACGICNHGSGTHIKRILIMSQTTFRDCRVHFCAFPTTFLEIAVCRCKSLFGNVFNYCRKPKIKEYKTFRDHKDGSVCRVSNVQSNF